MIKNIKFLIVLLLIPFMFYGCGQPQSVFYFNFKFDSLTLQVGEEININDLQVNTNLKTYEHMHIFCEDEEIAIVNGYKISALGEGTTKVTFAGFENGKYLHDYFYLNIINNSNIDTPGDNNGNNSGDNNSENQSDENGKQDNLEDSFYISDYVFDEDNGNCTYSFSVYKNDVLYQDIDFKIKSDDTFVISSRRTGGNIEIVCSSQEQVVIEITDNSSELKITVYLPILDI